MTRRGEWSYVGLCAIASVFLWHARGHLPGKGDVVTVPITLVPADAGELACSMSRSVGGYSCAFPEARNDGATTLVPCLTTDRVPFLVAGLFETSGIREYLARAPARKRFTAKCDLELVERVERYELRFSHRDAWSPGGPAWAAVPRSCRVE